MKKLLATLQLTAFVFHSNLFGNKKRYVKLDEEQLQKIEDELQKDSSNQIEELETSLKKYEGVEEAIEQAINLNGLEGKDSIIDNIVLLGEKCQEYGMSNERHSFPENNGKDENSNGLINGYMDPKDEHNKLLNNL